MKIQHFSNSFIIVETRDAKIVCDPWVGIGNHGGWHSYPEYKTSELIDVIEDCTHVYISHLHSDHLDLDFLRLSKLYKKKFIIRNFQTKALRNRLISINACEIIEVDDFKKLQISKKTNISIIPQLTSNNSGEEDLVNYSLDTSIIIDSEEITFFNQVDNPLSAIDFEKIQEFILKNYGELNIACLICGAASEYPQCFIGIDRAKEKHRVVMKSLKKLERAIQILKPANIFIAGGSYFIPGKFSLLNEYIGQPTVNKVKTNISNEVNFLELEGGSSITIFPNSTIPKITPADIWHRTDDVSQSIELHKRDLYHHQLKLASDNLDINLVFEEAKINYFTKVYQVGLNIKRQIVFLCYENLEIDKELNILSEAKYVFRLFPDEVIDADKNFLKIHIDIQAFYGCLKKDLIWNQVISGSLCIFERVPNTHEPDLLFSLNFLVI